MICKTIPMQNQKKYFRIFLIFFIAVQATIFIYSIIGHKLNDDEAWLGEQSFFMSQNGFSSSHLFSGFNNQDQRIVVQHKLFIYTLAFLISVFGFSLPILRIVPIISFIFLILLLLKYIYRRSSNDPTDILFLIALIFSYSEILYFGKIARPEMFVAMLGFASFYFLSCLYSIKQDLLRSFQRHICRVINVSPFKWVNFCLGGNMRFTLL